MLANISAINIRSTRRATATLPQTAQGALFTIAGGDVKFKIFGVVTTVIQTQLNNTKIVANPTTGADVDICTVNDITADAVGTTYTITGILADAMIATTSGAVADQVGFILGKPGTIDLSCSASNTGNIRWYCEWYSPEGLGTLVAV